ncbi:amylo-alpha-1,6-glucosidase, partial [Candidatus Bathyarchaeota archaeon]|nr:amylo-alpha-1,6-glucosidase [Candidatus Bathyarchaeota archaeon]
VLLAKLDEEIKIGNEKYALGANEFRDVMHPKGYLFLSDFSVAPLPTFRYDVDGVCLQKTVFMPYMKNATVALYEASNVSEEKVVIRVSPLVNSRHIYNVTEKDKLPWNFVQKRYMDGIVVEPSDSLSSLILSSGNSGSFVEESWWVEKLFYRIDDSRSESSIDDYFRPGFFSFSVGPEETKQFFVLAVAGKNEQEAQKLFSSFGKQVDDVDLLYREELERRNELIETFHDHNAGLEMENWLKWLIQAADSFIVSRASTGKKSVLAGYNWFDDWGRDALISLPGLTLVTGRFRDAQEILLTFGRTCHNGVIPNRFSDKAGDIPLYNTVDATLWFFNAVLQYLKYTGDYRFVQENLWKTLTEIVERHVKGTIFGIHMEEDGLIAHGPQLTWMDAATIDRFVTPRNGKAVEIQALWYNALKTMELLAKRFNQADKAELYCGMAENAKTSFSEKFWNPVNGYLYDVVSEDAADSTLRPNQIIAVSLDFPILDRKREEKIVDVVWKSLWGKYGLKTLPTADSRYIGKYVGDWGHRDSAYHNGTVWAWLLGPFTTAFLKTKHHEESWRSFAFKRFLQPLFSDELYRAGLGTVSEIFDGDEPHVSRGCISQAWSVAEPLRAYVEDVALKRPSHEQEVLRILDY